MKKFFIIVIGLILLTGCSNHQKLETEKSDAILFKEEYESLNNQKNASGKSYRSLEIDEDNSFIYKSALEIVEMIDNKETFVVYFGFASCPWCRSMISTLTSVAEDLGISRIYYVDVLEIRDIVEIDQEGSIVTTREGTNAYYQLLDKLDGVLDSYILTDANGNEIDTSKKRIYAPNIISIVDGEATGMVDGISDKQTDAYMELTNEMNEEAYDEIKCSIECVLENTAVCSAKTKC